MYFELGKLASMVVLILFYPKRQNRKLKQKHFLNNFIYTFYYLYLSLVILSEFAYHTFIIIFINKELQKEGMSEQKIQVKAIQINIAHNQVIKLTLLSFCRCFTDVYPTNHFSNQSNLSDLPNQTNHRVCTYMIVPFFWWVSYFSIFSFVWVFCNVVCLFVNVFFTWGFQFISHFCLFVCSFQYLTSFIGNIL